MSLGLARSLAGILDEMKRYPASLAQFSKAGTPYASGDVLKQPDLARTLDRIANRGPAGFYEGETAGFIEREMRTNGGIITREDLKSYKALKRAPLRGTYRGYEILGMPPARSGGVAVVQALNILEGFDLKASGYGSAKTIHTIAESMRRAFADRARHLGDPAFNADMPVERLTSKDYAATLRRTISPARASVSSPTSFTWPASGDDTTHVSVVDEARNAVALTYTLEYGYGSRIVVPGAGFLLNNEMDDFAAVPGQPDGNQESANRPVPDRDVLAVEGVDPIRVRAQTGAQTAEPVAVHVEDDVVGLDLDGIAGRHGGDQAPGEAVHAPHG